MTHPDDPIYEEPPRPAWWWKYLVAGVVFAGLLVGAYLSALLWWGWRV